MEIEAAILWDDTCETDPKCRWGMVVYYLGRKNGDVCWIYDEIFWVDSINTIINDYLGDNEDILVLGTRNDSYVAADTNSIVSRPFNEEELKAAKYLRSLHEN